MGVTKLEMVWQEGEHDAGRRKGLAVEIMFEGEVLHRHAISQEVGRYKRSECVKWLFYWMIDNNIFDDVELSPIPSMPESTQELPF